MNTINTNAEDAIICSCSGTKRSQIERLFNQGMDLDEISRWTGAVSGCGGCEWDIEGLLLTLAKPADNSEQL